MIPEQLSAILRRQLSVRKCSVVIGGHSCLAHAPEGIDIGAAVIRIVDMHNCAPVLHDRLHGGIQAFLNGIERRVLADDLIHLNLANLLQQRGNVLIVIIEGIAVDPAAVRDIPDRDLPKRLFI